MAKKYTILWGVMLATLLLLIAMWLYPGGSLQDPNSTGFDWQKNFLSNLFGPQALNGAHNPSRFWAIAGMFALALSVGLFFVDFSRKIPYKSASGIIRYFGIGSMVFTFLAATPLNHHLMITIADVMALLSMFYITVFLLKSKLHALKVLSAICLLNAYLCTYLYYSGNYMGLLPILQKAGLVVDMIWVIGLTYFTRAADFQIQQTGENATSSNLP